MISIRLFGGLSVSLHDHRLPAPTATQPRRLAVLAMIAQAGDRGISRERLQAFFWPDSDEDAARRGLTQALYALRTGLDAEQIFSGVQELRLNRELATCDVLEYADAIAAGEFERAAVLYKGPFLDGFRVPGVADFDRRVEELRSEFASQHQSLIERLALRASKAGETDRAVEWWRQLAALDPFNARIAEAFMRALDAAGDRIGAMRHARVHAQLVQQEFGTAASAAVTQLAEQLRSALEASAPVVAGTSDVPAPVVHEPVAPSASEPVPTSTLSTHEPRRARTIAFAGLAVTVLIAVAIFSWNSGFRGARRSDQRLRDLRTAAPVRIAADDIFELDPAISPDGRHIAYVAGAEGEMRVYVRQRDGSQALLIAESVHGDQRSPRWSPDGSSIVFQSRGGVWIVPALGGTPRLIIEPSTQLGGAILSAVFSPNGQDIAWAAGDTIYRMRASGGERRVVTSVPNVHSLAWSPGGQWIAAVSGNTQFALGTNADAGRAGVAVGNLAPSAIVLVGVARADTVGATMAPVRELLSPVALNASPAWIDSSTVTFVSSRGGTRDLFAARVGDDGALIGDAQRITAGLDVHSVTASSDGTQLAYAVFRQSSNVWSLPIQSGAAQTLATATRVTHGAQVVEGLDVSLDGRWLAYDADAEGQQDIFRLALKDGAPLNRDAERIVSSPQDDFHPSWSPDAQWIAYYTFRENVRRASIVSASGGTPRLIHPPEPNLEEHSPVWTSDGQSVVFFRGEKRQTNLFRAVRTNDTAWSPSQRLTTRGGVAVSFTADGKQAIYYSAPGTISLTDSTFSDASARVVLAPSRTDGIVASSARITPDGRAIVVKGYDTSGDGFWWFPLQRGVVGRPRLVVRLDDPRRNSPRPEFTSDGRHVFFTLAQREADVWAVRLERR